MAALQQGGAEMYVVEMQRIVAERDVHALAAARFAGPPGQVVIGSDA
jgi:hypothetical protein